MSTCGYLLLLLVAYRFGQIGFLPLLNELRGSWIYELHLYLRENRRARRENMYWRSVVKWNSAGHAGFPPS